MRWRIGDALEPWGANVELGCPPKPLRVQDLNITPDFDQNWEDKLLQYSSESAGDAQFHQSSSRRLHPHHALRTQRLPKERSPTPRFDLKTNVSGSRGPVYHHSQPDPSDMQKLLISSAGFCIAHVLISY
jgi:hypothetical protein